MQCVPLLHFVQVFSPLTFDQFKHIEATEEVGYFGEMYTGRICEKSNPNCLWPQVDDVHIAIDIAKLPSAMSDIRKIVELNHVCFPVFGMYIRFGLQSETLLGMQSSGEKAYIELHILRRSESTNDTLPGHAGVDEIAQLLLVSLILTFLNKYQGVPHFGKNFPAFFTQTRERMPKKWNTFTQIREKFDPNRLFDNDFLGLIQDPSKAIELQNKPGCAIDRSCFCKTDEHCGSKYRCVAGSFYKEARTCKKRPGIGCGLDDECVSGKCFLWRCK